MVVKIDGTNGIQNVLGTSSAPADTNTTSTNTGVYYPTSTTWAVATAATNAMYIDASQNVGIGTTSPANKLDIAGTGNQTIQVTTNTSGNPKLILNAAGQNGGYLQYNRSSQAIQMSADTVNNFYSIDYTGLHQWYKAGGTETMRLDSSGNVGIGTTSLGGARLAVTNNASSGININESSNSTATYGYLTIGQFINGAFIGTVAGSNTASNILRFGTGNTEQMRIDSSGNVGIGTTSPSGIGKLAVVGSSSSVLGSFGTATNASARFYAVDGGETDLLLGAIGGTHTVAQIIAQQAIPMTFFTSNAERMRIDSSGNLLVGYTSSNGSYKLQVNSQIFATSATIATSDANYKTNVTPLSGALNLVQKLNPVSFNWEKHPVHNFDTETPTVGFLAQEVQSALADTGYVNSIVKESEVTLPDNTKEQFLGIAEGNMIALLTKAIQELSEEVTALKAKVGA